MEAPHVALVTVSFGSQNVLPALLASAEAASSGPIELVVADNKPDDGTVSQIAALHGARYVSIGSNAGYGAAVNAATKTLGDHITWVAVANPDLVLTPGAVDALVGSGSLDDRIGAIGPRILTAEGAVYPSARPIPSLRTGIGHALFANLWPDNPWSSAYRLDRTDATTATEAGWLSGAFLLVRRSAFDELGGFDESYFMYFEDVDLGYRLGRAGWLSVYEPAAEVVHLGAHSTSEHSAQMLREHHRSARTFLSRKYSGILLLPVRVGLNIGLAIRSRIAQRRAARGDTV